MLEDQGDEERHGNLQRGREKNRFIVAASDCFSMRYSTWHKIYVVISTACNKYCLISVRQEITLLCVTCEKTCFENLFELLNSFKTTLLVVTMLSRGLAQSLVSLLSSLRMLHMYLVDNKHLG